MIFGVRGFIPASALSKVRTSQNCVLLANGWTKFALNGSLQPARMLGSP